VSSLASRVDVCFSHRSIFCSDVVKLLVANKIDLGDRQVAREEGLAFAKSKAMVFIECSAKTKLGIQQAFEELVTKILETPSLYEKETKSTGTVSMNQDSDEQPEGVCSYC
jgi:Ras-related protein Rab-18